MCGAAALNVVEGALARESHFEPKPLSFRAERELALSKRSAPKGIPIARDLFMR